MQQSELMLVDFFTFWDGVFYSLWREYMEYMEGKIFGQMLIWLGIDFGCVMERSSNFFIQKREA